MANSRNSQLFNRMLLLYLLQHGGEWPDWGDPFGQMLIAAGIISISTEIKDPRLRNHFQALAKELMAKSAQAL